jgi:hypothetical protein
MDYTKVKSSKSSFSPYFKKGAMIKLVILISYLSVLLNSVSAQSIEVPFQVVANKIIIEACINDTINGIFILDTGSSLNLLNSDNIRENNTLETTTIEGVAGVKIFML